MYRFINCKELRMFVKFTLPFLAVCVSLLTDGTLAYPHELQDFADIVAFAKGGAPILVAVNVSQCTRVFPKDLSAYSFTERLDFFTLTDAGISFNRETPVNGTRLQLAGPATRILAMKLDDLGNVNFLISDVNPETGNAITSAQVICTIGEGLRAIAGSGLGLQLTNYSQVVAALQGGYRVMVAGDLSQCQRGESSSQRVKADNLQVFGEITDHRFAFTSFDIVAFSKQIPFVDAQNQLEHGYGDVKMSKDGSIDVYYYEYKPTDLSPRQHWKCILGQSFKYFTVINN